jgi:type VI secretion system secreted protein Hcp
MAFHAFIKIKATKQGQFKGEGKEQARIKANWMPIVKFNMQVVAPRDAHFGAPTGERQYEPITIVKEWGAASPQALTAIATNEKLPEVEIEFEKTSPEGKLVVYQSIKLTNASFVDITRHTAEGDESIKGHGSLATLEVEKWAISFEKIEVDDKDNKTSFADDWQNRGR